MGYHETLLSMQMANASSAGSSAIATDASVAVGGRGKRLIWFLNGGCSSNCSMILTEAGTQRFALIINGATDNPCNFPSPIPTDASNSVALTVAVGGAGSTFASIGFTYG